MFTLLNRVIISSARRATRHLFPVIVILLDPVQEIDDTAGWPRMRAEDTPEA